jgi:serine/threonine protein kinase
MNDRPGYPAAPLAAGDRIDKFEIVDQIGAGAGSIVFKAYDRLLDRHVAIKQLMPGENFDENDPVHEQFRAEAGALKKVAADAKHVTRIIDLIDEPRGLFIIMEYVDGISLEHRLATTQGPLDERDALGIVAATAVALESIHKAGLIHRDLKPSNILLPKGGGLKVCDFGIAAMIEDQEAMSVGTVRYMAPELFGNSTADGRADIYSLGLIAYELLAGRDKFNAAFKIVLRDQRNQALRWMKWHTNLRATPPALNELNPKVSPTLAELVARMMEKDPARRVPTATDLIGAIRRHFAGDAPQPIAPASNETEPQASAISDSAPTSSLPKPSRWPVVLAVVLSLQLALGLGYLGWQSHQRTAAAEHKAQNARDEFRAANEQYDQGRFQEARDTFQALADEWGEQSMVGRRCALYIKLVDARMAIEADRFDEARAALLEIQNSDMIEPRYAHIQDLLSRTARNLGFTSELAKIETLLESGRLGEAQQTIDELSRMDRTGREHEQLAALSSRVDALSRQRHVDVLLADIDAMLEAGVRDKAIDELRFALDRTPNPRVEARWRELTDARTYDAAVADADRALGGNDLAAAIASLERAAKVRPDDALASRIRALRGRLAFEHAQAAEQSGDTATALRRFTESAGFGHAPARQAIARIETANKVQAFAKAGDQAMSRRDFAAATEHYNSALGIESNRDITARRDNAMARLEIDKAEQLLDRDEVQAARQAIDRALSLMPDDAQARQLLADIDRQARYLRLIAEGDALRSEGRYGEAATRYRDAKREKDTELVAERIKQVEYDGIVANAKHYMKQRQWAAAEAMLNTALKISDTPEARQLLAEIRTHTGDDDE